MPAWVAAASAEPEIDSEDPVSSSADAASACADSAVAWIAARRLPPASFRASAICPTSSVDVTVDASGEVAGRHGQQAVADGDDRADHHAGDEQAEPERGDEPDDQDHEDHRAGRVVGVLGSGDGLLGRLLLRDEQRVERRIEALGHRRDGVGTHVQVLGEPARLTANR